MGLFKFYWTDATNELKTSVSDGKTAIAAAVTDKGVNTAASDSFETMASNIGAIPTGTDTSDATATAAQILSRQTAYVKGSKVTGTMANQGAKTSSLNCGGSYTIPAGYHNGSGKITANSLSSQTSATATASKILSGYTAWVNGSKLTGTATGGKTNASFDSGSIDARFTRVFWNKTEGVTINSFNGTTLSITCKSDDGWSTTFNIILS